MSTPIDKPRVFRLKTKPPELKTTERKQMIERMVSDGFIGTGWPIEKPGAAEMTREMSIKALRSEGLRSHEVAIRFIRDTRTGDLVWIVDLQGLYHLGAVSGEYRYQSGNTRWEKELSHQFPCNWIRKGMLSSEVPAGIKNALKQGQAYCRIKNPFAERYSLAAAGHEISIVSDRADVIEFVDDEALEDLVGLYLQHELNGYLLPSSAKRSNSAYEFVIISKDGKRKASVQVKSGKSSIDTALDPTDAECYLFAVSGEYPTKLNGNIVIAPEELIEFAYQHQSLLPPTITYWML